VVKKLFKAFGNFGKNAASEVHMLVAVGCLLSRQLGRRKMSTAASLNLVLCKCGCQMSTDITVLSLAMPNQVELVTEEMSANPIFSNSVKFNQIHN
jgi:hypothetical protein